jgi:hypothetical protein
MADPCMGVCQRELDTGDHWAGCRPGTCERAMPELVDVNRGIEMAERNEPCAECASPTTIARLCGLCAYLSDGTVQDGFNPEWATPGGINRLAAQLAEAVEMVRDIAEDSASSLSTTVLTKLRGYLARVDAGKAGK